MGTGMKHLSLRNQIFIWLGVCLLIPTTGGIAFSAYTLLQEANAERASAEIIGQDRAISVAIQVADAYQAEMDIALGASRQFAKTSMVTVQNPKKPLDRSQVTAMLKNVFEDNLIFLGMYSDWEPNAFDGNDKANIGQADADGNGRYTPWWARSGNDISLQICESGYEDEIQLDYYRLPMDTRQETLLEPYIDTVNGAPILMTSLIVPMFTPEKYLGMTGVDIALTDLQAQVDQHAADLYNGSAQVEVISNAGLVVAVSGKPEWAGKSLEEVAPERWKQTVAFIQKGQKSLEDGKGNLLAFAAIQPGKTQTPWTVILTIPLKVITQQADADYQKTLKSLYLMIGLAVASLLVALVFLWRFANAIANPIRSTAGFLKQAAAGDLTQDVPAQFQKRTDEIGSLAQSTQSMIASLRAVFANLSGSVETLNTSSATLLSAAKQTAAGAKGSSLKANLVAAAAEEMSVNTQSVANRVDEVSANLDSIATSTELTSATIGEIARDSDQTHRTIMEAANQADQISVLMDRMGQSAQEIGKVTDAISGISAQTNLLALNATIEAARAGASGKGFAVVASEIKELARQASQATEQVRSQVEAVQAATTDATHEIGKIIQVIREMNQTVTSITTKIDNYTSETRLIAGNISQASLGLRDTNTQVGESALVTQEIAKEINGFSSTTQDMASASAMIQTSALELADLSEQLKRMVNEFHRSGH
jgi:methyl-accepting chemotaxis protein